MVKDNSKQYIEKGKTFWNIVQNWTGPYTNSPDYARDDCRQIAVNNSGNLWGYVNQTEADFKQDMLLKEMNRQ